MKPCIPREQLVAFARECLKLEELLTAPEDQAELVKFLKLIGTMEKSGGIAVLEALLRPETSSSAGLPTAPSLKEALRPHPVPSVRASHTIGLRDDLANVVRRK